MPRQPYGIYETLPKPDGWENYYFRRWKDDKNPVAILTRQGNPKTEKSNAYMLSLGLNGVVWSGTAIREFANAVLALEHLHELIEAGEVPVYPPSAKEKL